MSPYFRLAATILGAIGVLMIIGSAAGNSDFDEAKRQEREYCTMVEAGAWPDYNHNAAEICADDSTTTN